MTHDVLTALINAGRLAGQRGLLWGTGGNLSAREDADHFVITARGTTLDMLRAEDLVRCVVEAGPAETAPEASSETQVHRRIYQCRPDVGAVTHLSPPYATLVSCTEIDLPHDLIPESALYLGPIARIPYIQPGTDELGQAVAQALGDGAAVLMGNHGPVTVGESLAEALRRMESLEFLAQLVVNARAAGLPLRGIGSDAVANLRHGIYGRSS